MDDLIAVVLQDLEIADVSMEGEGEAETGSTGYDPYKHSANQLNENNNNAIMKSEQSNDNNINVNSSDNSSDKNEHVKKGKLTSKSMPPPSVEVQDDIHVPSVPDDVDISPQVLTNETQSQSMPNPNIGMSPQTQSPHSHQFVNPNPYIINDQHIVNKPFDDMFAINNSHLYSAPFSYSNPNMGMPPVNAMTNSIAPVE